MNWFNLVFIAVACGGAYLATTIFTVEQLVSAVALITVVMLAGGGSGGG